MAEIEQKDIKIANQLIDGRKDGFVCADFKTGSFKFRSRDILDTDLGEISLSGKKIFIMEEVQIVAGENDDN